MTPAALPSDLRVLTYSSTCKLLEVHILESQISNSVTMVTGIFSCGCLLPIFVWVCFILCVFRFYKKIESCPLDWLKLLCNASLVVRSVFVCIENQRTLPVIVE